MLNIIIKLYLSVIYCNIILYYNTILWRLKEMKKKNKLFKNIVFVVYVCNIMYYYIITLDIDISFRIE